MLHGKGLWAYRKWELDRALEIAPEMGITHILYKVGQGSTYYGGMTDVVARIRDAGLTPFGWTWVLLDDPQAEAENVARAFRDGFEGFIFDTEAARCRNRFDQAVRLGSYIRTAGLDLTKLYNCSYPNILHHLSLPFDQMNEYCKGGLMPMSYGTFFLPGSSVPPDKQAERVIDEWTYGHYEYWCRRWAECPPIYPVLGPYHDEHATVRMDAEEFEIWLDRLAAHEPSFFSLFTAAVIDEELFPLVKAFGVKEVVEDETVGPVLVRVHSPELGFLNVRPIPSTDLPPLMRLDHDAVVEALESADEVRGKVGKRSKWVRIQLPEGAVEEEEAAGFVAARYLRMLEGEPQRRVKLRIVSPVFGYLNVRPEPSTERPPLTRVDNGAIVEALEPEEDVEAKVDKDGKWLYVQTASGVKGYVAAWHVKLDKEEPTPEVEGIDVIVESPVLGFLNVRPDPSTDRPPLTRVDHEETLTALDPAGEVKKKIGERNEWLHVATPEGVEGYVSARYLRLKDEEVVTEPIHHLRVHSSVGLNVRKGAGTYADVGWKVGDRTVLTVKEDPGGVKNKVQKNRWIKVQTPSLHEGYVNGLYVRPVTTSDRRKPVSDASLPKGESAWIFGMHAADSASVDFRFLFDGSGKSGWMLVTHALGTNASHQGGHDYRSWSDNGYGVIARLNHGYEPQGTLPVRAKYPDFADACAEFVRKSTGCHIWIIGNEQNNVREHPGGAADPIEHITPRMYAEAFNMTRRRIKQVQSDAIVVPGAVDPYNTYPWARQGNKRNRPLEYFKTMLEHIDGVDGIALHTYTHWMDVGLITSKRVFGDEFLKPGTPDEHYYDFQAYRTFAEAIPKKWRDRPIYITESNHWLALDHEPQSPQEEQRVGWVNKNVGWVQAAYEEIHRWNSTPHAQQIHCLLLYRWSGDAWALHDKGAIHKDFRQALQRDYRWRR